jgi:hypothetical protein
LFLWSVHFLSIGPSGILASNFDISKWSFFC